MLILQETLDSLKLSDNFTAAELCASMMAEAGGIANLPTLEEILNLAIVTRMCLQPVRDHFKTAIPKYNGVTSGFRSLDLNRLVGSKDSSDHRLGRAIDFQVPGISNMVVAKWMVSTLWFDQLILENHGNGDEPNRGWLHVSYRSQNANRNQALTYDGKRYVEGLHYYGKEGI